VLGGGGGGGGGAVGGEGELRIVRNGAPIEKVGGEKISRQGKQSPIETKKNTTPSSTKGDKVVFEMGNDGQKPWCVGIKNRRNGN